MAAKSEELDRLIEDGPENRSALEIEGDIYGMCVVSLVVDGQKIAQGTSRGMRLCRLIMNMGLLWFQMFFCMFLLLEIRHFVSAVAVKDARFSYRRFEAAMYDEDGSFHADRFHGLDEDMKAMICAIPFSQPSFFYCVLGMWSLVIIGEFKGCWTMFEMVCLNAQTTPKVVTEEEDGTAKIVGVPALFKAVVTFFVVLPRAIIGTALLWLGCRWLAATDNFQDLILNAVALEFVVNLRVMIYEKCTPARAQRDLQNTTYSMPKKEPRIGNFLVAYSTLFVVGAWVFIYVNYLQQVLPSYKWDVHSVCESYVAEMSDFSSVPTVAEIKAGHLTHHHHGRH